MEFNIIVAITLDGRIARSSEHQSTDWTSKEDALNMRAMLNECDAIIVGRKTYDIATPLHKRNCIVFTGSVDSIQTISDKCVLFNAQKSSIKDYAQEKGYKKIAVLGGAQIYDYFLDNRLIDNLYLTVEPVVFGGGVSVFNQLQNINVLFELVEFRKLNDRGSMLLHYKLNKSS